MPNVFDIAKVAGVSKSTVSRVVNHQAGVKADKRKRVQEAIEKLNYTPNAMARGLVLQKTHTIGVVVKELSNSFYSEYIRHIHYLADQRGYGVLYCNRNKNIKSNIDYLAFLNKKVDGFIFLGDETVSQSELQALFNSNYPVVVVGTKLEINQVTYLNVNNEAAYYSAVKYLAQLGHQYILNISGPENDEFVLRNKGYAQAIKDFNLPYEGTFYTDYSIATAYEMAKEKVKIMKENGITAAVCSNNMIATGFVDGLMAAGVKVPEDFSIIGFDDLVAAEVTNNNIPAITSIRQPQKEMSDYAIEKLLQMMEEGVGDFTKVFECTLMKRNSTMPCSREKNTTRL